MYRLDQFGFSDMMDCRKRIRQLFETMPDSLGEAAELVVKFFRTALVDESGAPACALVRVFKTHPYSGLDPDTQQAALTIAPGAGEAPDVRCLVLMATAGDEPEWNSRETSRGHRAIPLMSEKMVEEAPMISQLIKQFGVNISTVLGPEPGLFLDATETSYNVFYVPEALGSPYIRGAEGIRGALRDCFGHRIRRNDWRRGSLRHDSLLARPCLARDRRPLPPRRSQPEGRDPAGGPSPPLVMTHS